MKSYWLFVWCLLGLVVPEVVAQKVVHGVVVDAATGEQLPAATVQVEGTYRGTITNAEGAFELRIDAVPAALIVRFIGYETARVPVTEATPERLDVRLQPIAYELGEIVVTGEDPAIQIMRKVIERKQVWRAALETCEAEVYNRFTLANDTGIVSIIETLTQTYWDHERGMKEVLKDRRETANIPFEDAMPAAFFVTNLYDDDIEVGGYTLIGVTHPEALRQYDFRLEGTRSLDGQTVYDISVRPKHRLKSAFVGRVAVLDEAFALLEVELRPGEAFLFPPPVDQFDVTYRQQFSSYGKDFWLPVDFRSETTVKLSFAGLLSFPTFNIDQVSRFANYQVNTPLPDSLYEEEAYLTVDSTAVAGEERLADEGVAVPLSEPERVAYATIDSTNTLEQAYAPTGLLARFVDMESDSDDEGARASGSTGRGKRLGAFDVEPSLWYNRVDALHAGLMVNVGVGKHLSFGGGGGFNSGLDGSERWSYEGRARLALDGSLQPFVEARYEAGTAPRYTSDLYNRFVNGIAVLFGSDDYFDYYRREGVAVTAGVRLEQFDAALSVGFRAEEHTSLERTTSYDFVGRSRLLRVNPAVREGTLRALTASVVIGDTFNPLHLFGQNQVRLALEHSTPDAFGSDFDYTRVSLAASRRIPTFQRRRLIPNALDVRLVASAARGDLPVQRLGTVDGRMGFYTPFGALKTRGGVPYEGEEALGLFWEHNFRTVPFELLGLYGLARKSYNVILFGGHGRTWLSDERLATLPLSFMLRVPEGFHHELGLSISGLFSILRLDVAVRLDEPGVAVGVAAARLF